MALTFELNSPQDVLAKVRRELAILESAAASQDKQRISDALYNFSVTAYHVKDWLREHPGASFSTTDVEDWIPQHESLSICRDICNASKHRKIKKYKPVTASLTASVMPAVSVVMKFGEGGLSAPPTPKRFRVKAVLADGKRIDVLQVAKDAVTAWEAFFNRHGL
jgi:hypothetical protein